MNLARTVDSYEAPVYDEESNTYRKLTDEDLEHGALQLVAALQGTYTDINGKSQPVKGDLSKLQYVKHLKPAARKILKNVRHVARGVPGTQEARRQMRFEIEAMRLRYGVPLFVTFSPDESHQQLFVRMARTRTNDPVNCAATEAELNFGRPDWPDLAEERALRVDIAHLTGMVPAASWEQRRQILARDPLAVVDGFHTLVQLTLRHLFGMRICQCCPKCNSQAGSEGCQDPSGSNATLRGGIFGRMDAIYVTYEAQKSTGSLHAHAQCFVQALHQHLPLEEVFAIVEENYKHITEAYLAYNAHVARAEYGASMDNAFAQRVAGVEDTWPEHRNARAMCNRPAYLLQTCPSSKRPEDEAKEWTKAYLEDDVTDLQLLKQHHVHILDPTTNERLPLRGCQRTNKPNECKSEFPRKQWVTDTASVLCPCQLRQHNMPHTGRKNRLGSLHGPYMHEWLNPCHPAMLAALRGCNVDVQVPYRLPFRCAECGEKSTEGTLRDICLAAQRAQDAQTGYCADYCSKNQPMAFHEIKEFQKGHVYLHANLKQQRDKSASTEYVGKRHTVRLLNDAYCKGIVRGQVECANLRANYDELSIVNSERFSTTDFVDFHGRAYTHAVATAYPGEEATPCSSVTWKQQRRSKAQHGRAYDPGRAYGLRPQHPALWHLSPYEFVMYWEMVATNVPYTWSEWNFKGAASWDVTLTASGCGKLKAATEKEPVHLKPWTDFRLKEWDQADTIFFDDSALTRSLRHNWYLRRRRRPMCPHFSNSPVPLRMREEAERTALLATAYFRAWTLRREIADPCVPHVSKLKGTDDTWAECFQQWLAHLPSEETKRFVGNFLSVYRVRPTHDLAENSDDSGAEEALEVDAAKLRIALQTQVPQEHQKKVEATAAQIEAALARAEKTWQTEVREPHEARNPHAESDAKTLLAAARKKASDCHAVSRNNVDVAPARLEPSEEGQAAEKIAAWLVEVAARPRSDPNHCNARQVEFLHCVAQRVLQEHATKEDAGATAEEGSEPLRWAVHGGPGTGKSHVLRVLRQELFEGILGWTHGIQFKVLTLQAVMAEQVDGDTIHHGVGLHGRNANADISLTRLLELRAAATRWRWLLVDEISMVSAELLAQMEMRCRELVRDACVTKFARDVSQARPFGGLNVIFMGDWWQLEPPKGTFLATLPLQWLTTGTSKKRPPAAHGQAQVWSRKDVGVQGVTELEECERTRDFWLQQVQNEFRYGNLTVDTHAFLHGHATSVPGSWTNGAPECGQRACADLVQAKASPAEIREKECAACKADRCSRALVVHDSSDPRLRSSMADATCIFATNAAKYHVNKIRAQAFAAQQNEKVFYAIASDRMSTRALQAKADIADEKLRWLQRHDRECGNLYGVLPVCLGLPVVATDHLDRGRKILRGCRGTVMGWSKVDLQDPDTNIWNKLPAVLLVSFETAHMWQVDGLPPKTLPVAPLRNTWYLDAGRKNPQLAISRRQFPLAPAFASTAHSAQGQTIRQGVIADLQIGTNGNPLTSYVALTRVQNRHRLLIYRPFAAAPFQRGIGPGRDLLVRVWRQENIDWTAIREKHLQEKVCCECHERKGIKAYTGGQWKRTDEERVCKECTWRHTQDGCPWQCSVCRTWGAEEAFPGKSQTNRGRSYFRVCAACEMCKTCYDCGKKLSEQHFPKVAWKARHADRRVCNACRTRTWQAWKCAECKESQPKQNFKRYSKRHPSRPNGAQVCDGCSLHTDLLAYAWATRKRLARRRTAIKAERLAPVIAAVKREIAALIEKRKAETESAKGATVTMLQGAGHENVAPAAEPSKATNPAPAPSGEAACGSQSETQKKLFVYTCPFCKAAVNSQVRTGRVDRRRACGHQFRVHNGEVVQLRHEHVCPRCGTKIVSAKSSGRVRSQHHTPKGKACSQSEWVVRS